MSVENFKILGVPTNNVDASVNFVTDAFEFKTETDCTWSVTTEDLSIVGGAPVYDVEVSNNDRVWYKWDAASTNVNVRSDSAGSDHLGYRFMRIDYRADGATGGNLNLQLAFFSK